MKKSAKERFDSKYVVNPDSGCWEWTAAYGSNGYGQFRVGKMGSAHRASYEIHKGDIPAGVCVLHKCDNPKCVNPDHLFLGTKADNAADMNAKNRQARQKGSKHGRSKLTDLQVEEIRELHSLGNYTQRYLGRLFGVSYQQVSRIVNNKRWIKNEYSSSSLQQ